MYDDEKENLDVSEDSLDELDASLEDVEKLEDDELIGDDEINEFDDIDNF